MKEDRGLCCSTLKDQKATSKCRHTAPFIAYDDLRETTFHVSPSSIATIFVSTTDGQYADEFVDTNGGRASPLSSYKLKSSLGAARLGE